MDALRQSFEALGYAGARTYLQSGNVVFDAPAGAASGLARKIQGRLTRDFGRTIPILLRSGADLARVVDHNPLLSRETDLTKLHVTFLSEAPDPERAARFEAPAGVPDALVLAGRELYLICPDGYGRTKLNNAFVERRLGVAATTRSWKTVIALRDLTRG
jgi:uncharacterized protein (DUF1697 family)